MLIVIIDRSCKRCADVVIQTGDTELQTTLTTNDVFPITNALIRVASFLGSKELKHLKLALTDAKQRLQ